ncbi:DUF308 domain-containing protein [Bacillus sp. FJAT-42376]|uniref:DUF308 domain-containing protein n=1 Tax=Bacillus sp. FJAT-42376 TaxID=2014076 RepID=UPI001F156C1E|nr:DUF308 domain-containing protein [Bacillus sp. FJAT-42376]
MEMDKHREYKEETAAEVAPPIGSYRKEEQYADDNHDRDGAAEGRTTGYIAIALSIISLFLLPVILGAAGIIVGFVARRKGASTLGAWAIGIGAVSLILGLFVTPFF